MKIQISDRAFKQLKKIPPPHRENLIKAIDSLAEAPNKGKALSGKLSGYRSLRVGDYRIVYSVTKHNIQVVVLGHRSHIYEIIKWFLDFLFGL